MRTLLLGCMCSLFAFVLMGCQTTHHDMTPALPEYQFEQNSDYMQHIAQAQQQAEANNKLLLLVLGAQWCHDSRGLASNFSTPEMQSILQQRFVVQFVDVAYFDDLHHVPQLFGYHAIFGTPTVLVIDPKSAQVLNHQTVSKWQSAHSVPQSEYVEFFSQIGTQQVSNAPTSDELKQFIEQQVARLKQAYDHQRPIWADVRNGTGDEAELSKVATEVWKFRVQLQKDIHRLESELMKDPNSQLNLPNYPNFSWQ
ncbi:thioredoxin family protein [Shewanella maritima]|uniref:thioredoxin family protein n=1 Tax=Shewanella maritima TaxID=2520507 RepID=UPI003735BC87